MSVDNQPTNEKLESRVITNGNPDPEGKTVMSDLDLDNGDAIVLEGLPEFSRVYYARRDDILFEITHDRIKAVSGFTVHFQRAHAGSCRTTTIEEAYEFFHGSYEPTITYSCLGCSSTYQNGEPKPCSCPVGSRTTSIDYPEIPRRNPRVVVDGELLLKPL